MAGDHQDGSSDSRVLAPRPGLQHHPHRPALLLSDGQDILRAAAGQCPAGLDGLGRGAGGDVYTGRALRDAAG